MRSLHITQPGAMLRKVGKRLVIEKDKTLLGEVPLHEVERVMIYGTCEVTCQTIRALLEEGIDLCYLTSHGHLKGYLTSTRSGNSPLRVAQYEKFRELEFSIDFARTIIKAKIHNMASVLRYVLQRKHGTSEVIHPLSVLEEQLKKCDNIQTIMGVEGAAARYYFMVYGTNLIEPFTFQKRSRQPAVDQTNAMMNLGYMSMTREITSQLEVRGLDPYIGLMHTVERNKPSLALDLVEEFRQPVVDLLVRRTIQQGIIRTEHFNKGEGEEYRLSPEGLKIFFTAYQNQINGNGDQPGIRRVIAQQIHNLIQHINGEEEYHPFTIEEKEREDAPCNLL